MKLFVLCIYVPCWLTKYVFHSWLNKIILDFSVTSYIKSDTIIYKHDALVIFDPVCESSMLFILAMQLTDI